VCFLLLNFNKIYNYFFINELKITCLLLCVYVYIYTYIYVCMCMCVYVCVYLPCSDGRHIVRAYSRLIFVSRILLMETDCYTQEAKVVSDIRLC